VDHAEDNRKTVIQLDVSGIGATKFTSRLYDLTKLTKLNMSHNKLPKISANIKFLNQYVIYSCYFCCGYGLADSV
jgi:Leucine-rich repeat (LRR) protein